MTQFTDYTREEIDTRRQELAVERARLKEEDARVDKMLTDLRSEGRQDFDVLRRAAALSKQLAALATEDAELRVELAIREESGGE